MLSPILTSAPRAPVLSDSRSPVLSDTQADGGGQTPDGGVRRDFIRRARTSARGFQRRFLPPSLIASARRLADRLISSASDAAATTTPPTPATDATKRPTPVICRPGY